jgi:hypothetical protein
MTKSIKKSTIHVQNPVEKMQAKQDQKSITPKLNYIAMMICAATVTYYLNNKMIKSKPKRE